MATVTIHKPVDLQIVVIDGEPPVDQSAEVTALQAQVSTLTTERDAALGKIEAIRQRAQEKKAAQAAADAAAAGAEQVDFDEIIGLTN